jgi:L-asparaginase II
LFGILVKATVDTPEDGLLSDAPLTVATRGARTETLHRGTVVVASPDGKLVMCLGKPDQGTYIRSAAKPFQGMALVRTGTATGLGLDEQDLAIACSSHSGEPAHVSAVLALLQKAGLGPEVLQCGIHPPLYRAAADELVRDGQRPSVLHNNCSGKHAAMVAVCAYRGWPIDTYLNPGHPLQQLNIATISAFSGVAAEQIGVAVDGCGVPAFYIPVAALAVAFARLASGTHVSDVHAAAAQSVREAMLARPWLIAGTARFDTEFMEGAGGSAVCKGGALGCEGIGLIKRDAGVGMKMSDGSSSSIPLVGFNVLNGLGFLEKSAREALSKFERTVVRNHAGTVTGFMNVLFQIDEDAHDT